MFAVRAACWLLLAGKALHAFEARQGWSALNSALQGKNRETRLVSKLRPNDRLGYSAPLGFTNAPESRKLIAER
jgi:hypothetical protein